MATFRQMISGPDIVHAPYVFNPISAKLAEQAGFKALYLGGGGLGYVKCITEANLTLPELVQEGIAIRSVCPVPLILDGACGWGDPMHMHRTIPLAEAAGFCAIEIEDQILPKRVHHHAGVEHVIPLEAMVDKIKEAVAARTDPDFVTIGRTNAANTDGLEEAVRRGLAYKEAGADMLFCFTRDLAMLRPLGERLPGPLMTMVPPGKGANGLGVPLDELKRLGYRLLVDPMSPLLAMHRALRLSYQAMATGQGDALVGANGREEVDAIHETIELETLLEIERRTVEH